MTEFVESEDELSTGRLSDGVYRNLRGRILNASLVPGERLVELELARDLKVSQAPVRDALIRLAHDGLVVKSPRRGSYVATIDRDEARKVYDLRATLEEYAAREMCAAGTAEALDEMRHWLAQMHEAASKDDLNGVVDADMAFHRTMYLGAGHPVLPRLWPMLENTMRAFTAVSNRVYFRSLEQIAATHDPLLSALSAGDAGRSAQLFRDHVVFVWDEIDSETGERPTSSVEITTP